jgi:Tfp pilus assembly protein PilX
MHKIQLKNHKEAGFVSLFTVIFFILLMTVITVGFLRVMSLEQQQSLDNDLTASAIAAAESGIEDGKRAILAYNTTADPTLKTALAAAFTSNNCDSLTGSVPIRNALGLSATGNAIGNPAINQFYTCLTVSLNSPNYQNRQSAGSSDYIPLVAVGNNFQQIRVSWHLIGNPIGADYDGVPANYAPGPLLPPLNNVNGNPANSWSTQGYPAYLRVQLYGNPATPNFSRADIDARSHTMFLVPSTQANVAAVDSTTPINFATNDPRGFDQPKTALRQVKCVNNPAGNAGSYACTALLELPTGLSSTNNNFYLRVTPMYGQSHFQVSLVNGGSNVDMNGVQPIIDATGRAADVFRRQQARVRVNPISDLPEYVAESANTICKNMIVADGTAGSYVANNCP